MAAYATKAGCSPSKSLMICHIMLQDQSRVVRLPVNVYELLSKITKVGNHLNAQPDRQKPATYAEIGESSLSAVCQLTKHTAHYSVLFCRVCWPGNAVAHRCHRKCRRDVILRCDLAALSLQRGRWTCRWRR